MEELQLLHVPTVGRIPIYCRSVMVEVMLVIVKVREAMLATKSGFTMLLLVSFRSWYDVRTAKDLTSYLKLCLSII